jgi:uncharacterized coiled-coil DUF342 family protein
LEDIKYRLEEIEYESSQLKKLLHKDYPKPEDIKQGLIDLQKRYETTTVSAAVEKKIIADINLLKKSLSSADKILSFKPEIDQLFAKKKTLLEEIKHFNTDIAVIDKELD